VSFAFWVRRVVNGRNWIPASAGITRRTEFRRQKSEVSRRRREGFRRRQGFDGIKWRPGEEELSCELQHPGFPASKHPSLTGVRGKGQKAEFVGQSRYDHKKV